MKKIYSKIQPEMLLHIIHRADDFQTIEKGGRRDIIDPEQFLQLAAMNTVGGTTFKAHKHIWKDGEEKCIAQESWIVVRGSVQCILMDIDGTVLEEPIIKQGDCSVTLAGGHTYLILEDDTLVYEYKTGPYKGQENDKVFFD
jgi:hypothetical protein